MTTPSGQPVSLATSGIQVLMGDFGVTPATLVANLSKVDKLPETTVKTYDLTRVNALNDDSTADMESYVGFGKLDRGQLQFTMGGTESQISTLLGLAGVLKSWKVKFISDAYLLFNGGIMTFSPTATTGEEVTVGVTIKLSGGLTFVSADATGPEQIEGAITKTSTYNGASYDLTADFATAPLQASIQITSIDFTDEDETYSFTLQESSDNATFTACGPAVSATAIGTLLIPGIVSKRYVRLSATLGGTTPSITYITSLIDLIS